MLLHLCSIVTENPNTSHFELLLQHGGQPASGHGVHNFDPSLVAQRQDSGHALINTSYSVCMMIAVYLLEYVQNRLHIFKSKLMCMTDSLAWGGGGWGAPHVQVRIVCTCACTHMVTIPPRHQPHTPRAVFSLKKP